MAPAPDRATAMPIGVLIRQRRQHQRYSQMALALDAEVSPRHLSCVENGHAQPSATLLMALAEQLDVPLRERNAWLLAAGYAPRYSEQALDASRMAAAQSAIQRLLDTHLPYPGVALDAHWNVVLHNQAAEQLMASLPPELLTSPINMFRASLHPQGFAAHTLNFPVWARYLLQALQRLYIARPHDLTLRALMQEVHCYPNVEALHRSPPLSSAVDPPVLIPCVLNLQGQTLSLFTTLTAFGSPQDITLHELCVELFYPSDEATAQHLKAAAPPPRQTSSPPQPHATLNG